MSLKTICSFKRMRQFQPYSAVVATLRESTFLELSGEEGQEVVRRKEAYVSDSETQKARTNASVYAKGFGEEESATQFDIEAFFANYGHIKSVRLRRTNEGLFKGSVFVEFATAEEADAFVNLDPKPTFKGNELLIMKKKDYVDEKARQIKEGLIEPNTTRRTTFWEGKERGGGRGGRGRGRGRDGNGDSRDNFQKNGFKGGRGRGRGRGGRGGRGGRNFRDRDEKKSEVTRKNTNEYVSQSLCPRRPNRIPLTPEPVSRCRPSNPPPRRAAKPTASELARMTPPRRPRQRRLIPRQRLFQRNKRLWALQSGIV
jgi:lupus La protein